MEIVQLLSSQTSGLSDLGRATTSERRGGAGLLCHDVVLFLGKPILLPPGYACVAVASDTLLLCAAGISAEMGRGLSGEDCCFIRCWTCRVLTIKLMPFV